MDNTRNAAMGRLLGVDYGERRIGVAVSEGRVAVPLIIIERQARGADLDRIADIARDQDAAGVVVGLALGEAGEEGEQARRTRRFGEALRRRIGVPLFYHDERWSSARVAGAAGGRVERGGAASAARRGGRARIDDLAAAVILQSYLDDGGGA
jgi:putative Holliday junction resolvase